MWVPSGENTSKIFLIQSNVCRKVELYAKVKAVPFHFRKNNVWTLASKVGIPKSTIHDALKKGLLKHTRNTIRPILTDKNKADRVVYCCSFVQDGQFVDMLERVDIDEKWFYMTEVATSYILVPGETPPHRTCKHKSHIEKVCVSLQWRDRNRIP